MRKLENVNFGNRLEADAQRHTVSVEAVTVQPKFLHESGIFTQVISTTQHVVNPEAFMQRLCSPEILVYASAAARGRGCVYVYSVFTRATHSVSG